MYVYIYVYIYIYIYDKLVAVAFREVVHHTGLYYVAHVIGSYCIDAVCIKFIFNDIIWKGKIQGLPVSVKKTLLRKRRPL